MENLILKKVVGKIASDELNAIKRKVLNSGISEEDFIKIKSLCFYETITSPYVSSDCDIEHGIELVGIDNCARYINKLVSDYTTEATTGEHTLSYYHLRSSYIDEEIPINTTAGSFAARINSDLGVRNDWNFDHLSDEEKNHVVNEFESGLDILQNVTEREQMPFYQNMTDEQVRKSIKLLISRSKEIIDQNLKQNQIKEPEIEEQIIKH